MSDIYTEIINKILQSDNLCATFPVKSDTSNWKEQQEILKSNLLDVLEESYELKTDYSVRLAPTEENDSIVSVTISLVEISELDKALESVQVKPVRQPRSEYEIYWRHLKQHWHVKLTITPGVTDEDTMALFTKLRKSISDRKTMDDDFKLQYPSARINMESYNVATGEVWLRLSKGHIVSSLQAITDDQLKLN